MKKLIPEDKDREGVKQALKKATIAIKCPTILILASTKSPKINFTIPLSEEPRESPAERITSDVDRRSV